MPPRAERVSAQESSLGLRERNYVLGIVLGWTRWYQEQFAAAAELTRPYIEILALTKTIQSEDDFLPSEQAHIRKMIAIEGNSIPPAPEQVGSFREFLTEINNEAEAEFAELGGVDMKELRKDRDWRYAMTDIDRLKKATSQNPEE